MNAQQLTDLARGLDAARLERRSVERLTLAHPELSISDGYAIQAAGVAFRLGRGERQVGFKMGLTSEAKRQQMGLHSPVYGVLTDRMAVEDGGTLPLTEGIHPKIEPELAFRMGRPLQGTVTLEQAAAAVSGVAAAMEVLDSRFRDFKYFSLPDVVADNSSSFRFVVSRSWASPQGLALDRLPMTLFLNGEAKQTATSDAISGHPLVSVIQLCALLAERGQELPAGSVVLAGAATVAERLRPGDRAELRVGQLAPVSLRAD